MELFSKRKAQTKTQKFDEAAEDLTCAIALNPKNSSFYNERAKLFFNLGKTTEALADFNRVKELCDRESFIPEESMDKDKKSGLASLIDYLKWTLIGQTSKR